LIAVRRRQIADAVNQAVAGDAHAAVPHKPESILNR
jgi:hypothetical protein